MALRLPDSDGGGSRPEPLRRPFRQPTIEHLGRKCLSSPSRTYDPDVPWEGIAGESLIGEVGYVSVPIPAGKPGEVILAVRGGSEAFAAWADEPIAKAARVVVVDERSARSVTVTPLP
jgi:hypothetical protein